MSNAKRNDPCPCGSGKKYKQCCLKKDEATASSTRAESVSIPKAIQIALEHHQAGRFAEAEGLYRQILQVQPNQADALHLLGMLMQQSGSSRDAINLISRAIESNPGYFLYHNNLGTIYQTLNELDKAIACYRRALALKPDYADGFYNLANALGAQAKVSEAIECYRKAIALKPDYAEAYNNLGTVLKDQGTLAESAECYRKAIALKPNFVEALNNLGNVLKDQGDLDKAVACFQKALELRPDHAEAHNNLGNALKGQGKLEDAVACYQKALALNPGYADALFNLGNLKQAMGAPNEAIDSYRKAIALMPHHTDAYNNLGGLLADQNRLDEAIDCYRKVIALEPGRPDVHSNLGMVFNFQGRVDEAVACFRKALALKPDYASAHSNLLFTLNFDPRISMEEIYRVSQEYEAKIGLPLRAGWPAHDNDRTAGRRLRIGYVSADFRKHAVAYFAEPIFASHDKSQVEVFCYSGVRLEDEVTSRFRQLADHWHSTVGLSDEAAAQMIRSHEIDILVDLAGHTAGGRLPVFARKPAPVQIAYLGYPGTTGLSAMDYRITDHYADPEGGEAYYSEKLLRLPDSLCCYRPAAGMPEVGPLPALQNGYVTFGSLNNFNKVSDRCIDLWAEVLRAVPASRLLMLTVPEGAVREQLKEKFAGLGISSDRLEFHGKFPSTEFFRMFQRVDIAFDPFPVTGGTTTCETLWMGVPVIVLAGERYISRVGYSFLSAAGLHNFAVHTPEDYVRVATCLAEDITLLSDVHNTLRARVSASPLTDAAALTRNLENLYRQAWKIWCESAN